MRFVVSLLILLFSLSAFSAGQKDARPSRRALKGLGIEDDKFAELPVQSIPKDGYIVGAYQTLPIDVSNGFYQIWDEVHLDENMNNSYKSISLFKPISCGSLYIPLAPVPGK